MEFLNPICRTIKAALLLMIIFVGIGAPSAVFGGESPEKPSANQLDNDALHVAEQLSKAYRRAMETVSPAVVEIRSVQDAQVGQVSDKLNWRDLWSSYLSDRFDSTSLLHLFQPNVQFGIGSGVILAPDGYIVTSRDIIAGQNRIIVKTGNAGDFAAKVVRIDNTTGLALLKIDGANLPTATLASSRNVETADWVLAVGAAPGYSVAPGMIAAISKQRNTEEHQWYVTTAMINSANHGGPLINLRGEVVGINVSGVNSTAANHDFGMVVPSQVVSRLLTESDTVANLAKSQAAAEASRKTAPVHNECGVGLSFEGARRKMKELALQIQSFTKDYARWPGDKQPRSDTPFNEVSDK